MANDDNPLLAAQRRFLDALPTGPLGREDLPLEAALGRILADVITAPEDAPPYPRAIVEGHLVRAADTQGASEETPGQARIVGRCDPGDAACPEPGPGEAIAVATGSLVPEGDYAIVRPWEGQVEGDTLRYTRPFPSGFFIEARGADLQAGQTVLAAGCRLGARELGLAASLGLTHLPVALAPRVALFSIGGEVIPHHAPLRPGQIRDCNAVMLTAAIREAGGEPRHLGILPDDFDTARRACAAALQHADALVLSGGTAACGRDFVSDLFRELGELLVDGVPMRSGRPLIMGVAGDRPLIGVAGHPPEALRGLLLFGAPAIARLLGTEAPLDDVTIPWGAA